MASLATWFGRATLALGLVVFSTTTTGAQPPPKDNAKNRETLMIRALDSDAVDIQRTALILLGEIGQTDPIGRRLAPQVIRLLKSSQDPMIQAEGVMTLGKINAKITDALPVFSAVLKTSNAEVRLAAVKGLRDFLRGAGLSVRPVPNEVLSFGLLPPIGDIAWLRQYGAYADLVEASVSGLPIAARACNDADPKVRMVALDSIQQTALDMQRLLPNLVRDLANNTVKSVQLEETSFRWSQLVPVEIALAKTLPSLNEALRSSDLTERLKAARVLEHIGIVERRSAILGELLDKYRHEAPVEELPPMFEGLEARLVRYERLTRQVEGDENTPVSVPRNPNRQLRELRDTLAANRQLADDSSSYVRQAYVNTIETLDADALPLLGILLKMSNDPVVYVRWTAIRTLGKVAPEAPESIVPRLGLIISRELDLDVRVAAMVALEQFGEKGQGALEAVIGASKRGDAEARLEALEAIEKMSAAPEAILPALTRALLTPDESVQSLAKVRLTAAQVLYRMGDKARAAVPQLTEALRDKDPEVRRLAAQTILAIGRTSPRLNAKEGQ